MNQVDIDYYQVCIIGHDLLIFNMAVPKNMRYDLIDNEEAIYATNR